MKKIIILILTLITITLLAGCGSKQISSQNDIQTQPQTSEHAPTNEPARLIDNNVDGIQFKYTIQDYIQASDAVKDIDLYYKQLLQEYFKEHSEMPESESLEYYIYSVIRDYRVHPNEISIIQDEEHTNEKAITTYDNQSYTLYYSNILIQKIKDSMSDVKDDEHPYEAIRIYPNGDTKTIYFNYVPSSLKDYYNSIQTERDTGVKMR